MLPFLQGFSFSTGTLRWKDMGYLLGTHDRLAAKESAAHAGLPALPGKLGKCRP